MPRGGRGRRQFGAFQQYAGQTTLPWGRFETSHRSPPAIPPSGPKVAPDSPVGLPSNSNCDLPLSTPRLLRAPLAPRGQSRPRRLRERLNRDLVDVTPSPVLARLERSHNRVLGLSEVLRGVFVLRGVAAADVTANLAEPQMNPGIPHLQALLTSVGVGRWVLNLVKV